MLKHLVPMMKKMARPLLARRGAAQYPEHDLALAATFLWVIERHSGIFFLLLWGGCGGGVAGTGDLTCNLIPCELLEEFQWFSLCDAVVFLPRN